MTAAASHVDAPLERICVGCDCTDDNACLDEETGIACSWVADAEMDICSFCAAIALSIAEAEERDAEEDRAAPCVQLYSPGEAQRYIEDTRVMRAGGAA